ncbi:HEAT repeat domain-containing protein [Chryseolinea sp. H1M3-3]|uniref:HEAT repeat domain-containing protein n=1 Tax=Chryseolinea sp. H1M3-3 TaxID=3034144 RepID=UPI0023EA8152|nr:HEAT repeat domain-containing protein [Chryseolinea sp. H1M3-3]
MNNDQEKLEMQLIDYIDGKLSEAEKRAVEQELMGNDKVYKIYEQLKEVMHAVDRAKRLEPSQELKVKFDQFLTEEIASSKKGTKIIFFRPVFYRSAAAVALLVLGVGVGFWISKQNDQQQEISRIKTEMEATKMMMISLMDNKQSASQRIQGVNVALTIESADDEVVQALAKRMNEDPNTNVRLAALDALGKFHDDPAVRKILIDALSNQKDPVVQIALIQILVKLKEKGVVNDLKRIVEDEESMKAVKDEAYSGIMVLS